MYCIVALRGAIDFMIISFQHKGLCKFYETGSKKGIIANHETMLQMILVALDIAEKVEELNLPAFSLHALKGYWSMKVNGSCALSSGSKVMMLSC